MLVEELRRKLNEVDSGIARIEKRVKPMQEELRRLQDYRQHILGLLQLEGGALPNGKLPTRRVKAPSRSRQAGVETWIVDGRDIDSPMVSRMLAAVYGVRNPKDVYGKDSPERHARKPKTLAAIKAHGVEVVIGGQRMDAVDFLTQ